MFRKLLIKLQPIRLIFYNFRPLTALVIITLLSLLFMLTMPSIPVATASVQPTACVETTVSAEHCEMLTQATNYSKATITDEGINEDVDGVTLIRQYLSMTGGGGISSVFTIFFLTIGPLKIVPTFVSLTANADDELRKKMAFRSFWIATLVVVLTALFGVRLLDKYGIPLSALTMAAGIVLFLVALRIVMAQYGSAAPPPSPPENPSLDLVVTPLIFPTILTPYGIAVVMIIMSILQKLTGNNILVVVLLVLMMVLNLLSMLYARQILKVLKPSLLKVIGLVLGIIQLSLAITWMFAAIRMEALVIRAILTF